MSRLTPSRTIIIFAAISLIFSSSRCTAMDARAIAQTLQDSTRAHPVLACAVASIGGFYAFKKSLDYYLRQNIAPINIQLQQLTQDNSCRCLFSHGIADSHTQANPYVQAGLVPMPLVSFDYADCWHGRLRVNYTQTSLGQENEIERLTHVYTQNCTDCKTVIFGVSRGAAPALGLAAKNPESLGGLILESPYASLDDAVAAKLRQLWLSWIPGSQWAGMRIASLIFAKYKSNGPRPIDMVNYIKKDLPILIFGIEGDGTVPVQSSVDLYYSLKNSGHHNTYLYIFPAGPIHARMIKDQWYIPILQQLLHAFYKKHGFPHNADWADAGRSLLAQCQP